MAEESQLSNSRPDSKRKFDDGPCPPPPPSSYNSVPPPLDGIQLAKLRAQEIASKIFNEVEAKRPKVDNGAAGDDHVQKPLGQQVPFQTGMTQLTSYSPYGYGTSKKIEIPNGRVGVIIGKSGDTIKYLQQQSGAKIQVARDTETNPHSQTRPVELTGTTDQINRAEQLINEVLAEADAGVIANRKFGVTQPGSDHFSMKVANNKVGLIIGKGGEMIKSMQANSGARIQVIPLHLPPGDTSTERTVHIDGTPEQIEAAKKLVNEIINSENRARNPQMGGAYPQQSYRPPRPPVSWGPPGPPPTMQQQGYGYIQPGSYPGAPPQYMSQPPYGGYQGQPPVSGGYPSSWDQTSAQGPQQTTTGTGDDYNQQQPPTSGPSDNTGYNYGQPPSAYGSQGSYGDASYFQLTTGQQQSYSQDYSGGFNTQAPQSGYSQQTSTPQAGYDQQSYGSVPAYGAVNSTQDGSTSTYGAPGGTTPAQPSQQAPSVQPSPSQLGYASQPPSATPTSYPPQGTAQPVYGVHPASQPGYGQSVALTQSGYGQPLQAQKPPATQVVYGQPPTSQAGYAAPSQPGYGQPYQQVPPYGGAPPPTQAGYGQQQPYGDSYGSGGYSQPPPSYGSEGVAAPAAASGVTKASPQS